MIKQYDVNDFFIDLNFVRYKIQFRYKYKKKNELSGFSPQSELYRPSDRRLSAKLGPALADKGCRVVSASNPHGC
jgi:hypothetical protein